MVLGKLYSIIWDEYLWFPNYVNWETFKIQNETYRDETDVYHFAAWGFVFLLARFLFQCCVVIPIAHFVGIRGRNSTILSDIWKHTTGGFSSQSKMKKFLEVAWRFTFYAGVFIYGIWALWDKSWLWDIDQIWVGYPFHPIEPEIRYYYAIETSFYWSLTFSQFTDVKRNDFYAFMVHHVATITLLTLSWYLNMIRAGTLILIIHDASDAWLEAAKLIRYSNGSDTICNFLFGIFMCVWLVTRTGIYPFKLVRSAVFDAPNLIPHDHYPLMMATMTVMLIVLMLLHVVWTCLIFKVALKTVKSGRTEDVRSEDEGEETEPEKSSSEKKDN